jgi:multicomponent K+:H+ antiporter subunit D
MTHLPIFALLLPLIAGLVLLMIRQVDIAWRRAFSLAALVGQLAIAVMLAWIVADGSILTYALGNWPAPFGIGLVVDRLAAWMLLITALLAPFPLLHASRGMDQQGRHFHVLYQLQLFGLNGAFLTGDLFNLFVFFEVLLLASYGLVLHGGGRQRTKASLHYVVINLAGSSLFLIAVGTLYGLFGTLNMADLAVKMAAVTPEDLGPARAASLLLFAVFALKAALLPLSLWLPATYANTSAPVAALFAIMTKVGAYAILRTGTLLFGAQAGLLAGLLDAWLLPLALATLALGLFGALAARFLREQAAWLVVASIGTLLAAFALMNRDGLAAGLYYLPHSTFAAAALFLLADRIGAGRGESGDRFEPGPPLAGAAWLGGLFFVVAILLSGLPPLSGFVGKFLILRASLDHPAWPWLFAVVLMGGLFAMIALARSGSLLFFRPTGAPASMTASVPVAPAVALIGLLLMLTVAAGPVREFTGATADQLLQPHLYVHAVLGGRP